MAKATAQDVNNLFMEYLGRPADPEGSGFYSGKDIAQVAADLAYAAATGVEDKAANQAVTAAGGWDFAPPPPAPSGGGGGGGGSAAPSSPVTPLTAQNLYDEFLFGRPALEKDYKFWNDYIAKYGAEQAIKAFDVAADQERNMDLAARAASLREQNLVRPGTLTAQDLYNQFLGGRSALQADLDFWNNYITVYGPDKARSAFEEAARPEKEMPVEDLLKSLRDQNLTVPGSLLGEFATQRKATPAEVRSMYLSVLGREPDPEGFSYYTSQPIENLRQNFYQGSIPEMEKRVAAIPVTTAIPKPVIGQVSPQSRGQSVDIPGSFVTTNQGAPKPLTVDISTMPREQQDLTSFIVGKMPRPTTTSPGPMFTPGEVNAQLELERLKAMNAPSTTDQGPVAGFAEGGLVGNDINRMLQNQRNAVMRESQSRQMLTNLGAPPVKKFSDGGPAGSSSGVRRLEMSKIRKRQEGSSSQGEVSDDMFIQEMLTGTRPTDQEAFVERTSDVLSKTPKSQELANQIRNLFQSLETPSPSAQEEYLERRPTPESREPIRSRKAMEAFLKAANPRLEIEERPLPGGRFGFVRADDPDTLVISTRQFPAQREETAFHELEHSLSERGGNPLGKLSKEGKPIVMDNNYRFDVLYNQDKKIGGEGRFARHDMMNRFIKNKDKLEKFFGRPFDSNYFSREPESGLFAEQIADLSALEQVTNKSLTRDPEMRKLLFPDDKAAAVYDAITGLRQTRLDAKDLPPYTPNYPEEKSMMDWIRGKLGMDKK